MLKSIFGTGWSLALHSDAEWTAAAAAAQRGACAA